MSVCARHRLSVLAVLVGLGLLGLRAIVATAARPAADQPTPYQFHLPVVSAGLTGIAFEPVASGLSLITDIANAGDDRLFVAQRDGRIAIIQPDGTVAAQPFLDIHGHVETADREQGLLGVAFHPDYAHNGQVYVSYTLDVDNPDTAPLIVSRFVVDSGNANQVDRHSEQTVLAVPAAGRIHQGGALRFGPDGGLYVGVGDGSDAPLAQDPQSLRGKVLRIDVDRATAEHPQIWAAGLRNPYHIAFDFQAGEMIIADVGARRREEVNVARAAGLNFGWPCLEGPDVLSHESACLPPTQFTPPVFYYDHTGGNCAIIGGAVYRGGQHPAMDGHYFFGDFCTGAVWSLLPQRTAVQTLRTSAPFIWTAAGQDAAGEVYFGGVTGQGNAVVRLIPGR